MMNSLRLTRVPTAVLAIATAWFLGAAPDAAAQFLENGRPGIRVNSISVYSSLSPLNYGTGGTSWASTIGVSGGVSWNKLLERGSVSLNYGGGYGRPIQSRYSSQVFHSLGFDYNKVIRPRWNYSSTLNVRYSDAENSLFLPGILSATGGAAVVRDPTSGALLTGYDLVDSPAAFAIFGRQIVSGNFGTSLSFEKSPRLSYHGNFNLGRTQFIAAGLNEVTRNSGPLLQTTYAGVNLGIAYVLTPRVNLGADVSVSRAFASASGAYYTNATVSLNRTLKPWWTVQGSVGTGYAIGSNSAYPVPSRPQVIGSVGTSLTAHSQTFGLNAATTLMDPYGIGAAHTMAAGAFWSLHRPGAKWSASANFSETLSRGVADNLFTSWRASANFSRVLTSQLFLGVSAGYANFSDLQGFNPAFAASAAGRTAQGFRVSLTWSPRQLIW